MRVRRQNIVLQKETMLNETKVERSPRSSFLIGNKSNRSYLILTKTLLQNKTTFRSSNNLLVKKKFPKHEVTLIHPTRVHEGPVTHTVDDPVHEPQVERRYP